MGEPRQRGAGLGDVAAAARAYQTATKLEPELPDAANGLGLLLVQAGRANEAVPLFERALAQAPDFHEARLSLGIALQESGCLAEARDEYQAVLKAPPAFKREREAATELLRGLSVGR